MLTTVASLSAANTFMFQPFSISFDAISRVNDVGKWNGVVCMCIIFLLAAVWNFFVDSEELKTARYCMLGDFVFTGIKNDVSSVWNFLCIFLVCIYFRVVPLGFAICYSLASFYPAVPCVSKQVWISGEGCHSVLQSCSSSWGIQVLVAKPLCEN